MKEGESATGKGAVRLNHGLRLLAVLGVAAGCRNAPADRAASAEQFQPAKSSESEAHRR
jgi:hypothetical protein